MIQTMRSLMVIKQKNIHLKIRLPHFTTKKVKVEINAKSLKQNSC